METSEKLNPTQIVIRDLLLSHPKTARLRQVQAALTLLKPLLRERAAKDDVVPLNVLEVSLSAFNHKALFSEYLDRMVGGLKKTFKGKDVQLNYDTILPELFVFDDNGDPGTSNLLDFIKRMAPIAAKLNQTPDYDPGREFGAKEALAAWEMLLSHPESAADILMADLDVSGYDLVIVYDRGINITTNLLYSDVLMPLFNLGPGAMLMLSDPIELAYDDKHIFSSLASYSSEDSPGIIGISTDEAGLPTSVAQVRASAQIEYDRFSGRVSVALENVKYKVWSAGELSKPKVVEGFSFMAKPLDTNVLRLGASVGADTLAYNVMYYGLSRNVKEDTYYLEPQVITPSWVEPELDEDDTLAVFHVFIRGNGAQNDEVVVDDDVAEGTYLEGLEALGIVAQIPSDDNLSDEIEFEQTTDSGDSSLDDLDGAPATPGTPPDEEDLNMQVPL